MKTEVMLFLSGTILMVLLLPGTSVSQSHETEPYDIVHSNNAFAVDMYKQLLSGTEDIVFSPFSLATVLTMTYSGANGKTKTQMATTLHLEPDSNIHPAFSKLLDQINSEHPNIVLKTANAVFPQVGHPFLPTFNGILSKYYRVESVPKDYAKDPEAARRSINKWAEEKTEKKIVDLIPKGILDALTRMVLVNAIYFKGDWKNQFVPESTADGVFHLDDQAKVHVSMMHQKGSFPYKETDDMQVLEMPYSGNRLSFIVFLPKATTGLAGFEKTLTLNRLTELMSGLHPCEVSLSFPKIRIASSFRLKSKLKALGMTEAFDRNRADFSGMDGKKWLYISAVLQKAFLELDEKGSTAAAASAVVMRLKAMPLQTPEFRADHPFLFLIRDKTTGSILFMGRVVKPASH